MKKTLIALLCAVCLVATASDLIATRAIGTTGLVASRVVSKVPCKLYAAMGYNASVSTQYLFVFESGLTPTNGQSGKLGPFPVSGNQFYSVDLSTYGADLDAVTIGVSTTDNVFTNCSTNVTIQAILGR
jgi:hypothetical protein